MELEYLVSGPNYLLLAAVATSGVLLAAALLDDKSLRIDDLDKVVWVLLGRDSSARVSIIKGTAKAVTYAKHRLHVS